LTKSIFKSDQRILGESEFVNEVLSESERQFARKYRLKSLGYDFERVVERVSEIFQLKKEYITGKGRQQDRVMSRDLLCYWAAVELEMSMVDLARQLESNPRCCQLCGSAGRENGKGKRL